jgi:hypothetical protein
MPPDPALVRSAPETEERVRPPVFLKPEAASKGRRGISFNQPALALYTRHICRPRPLVRQVLCGTELGKI